MFYRKTVMANDEPSNNLALLTKAERDWLLGRLNVSNDYQNHLRQRIKKKLQVFSSEELPLLMSRGLVRSEELSITASCHIMTTDCRDFLPSLAQLTWRKSDTSEYEQVRYKNEIQIEPYDMGRVGFEPTTPAMSRRYLNQARPPAPKEEILSPTVSYNIIFQPHVSHLKVFHQTLIS
jgi:hypothetical protein